MGGFGWKLRMARRTFFRPLWEGALLAMGLPRCVIVPLSGGLGNQIWEYAVGAGMALGSGLPVLYDLGWFAKDGKDIEGKANRNFDLLRLFPGLPLEATPRGLARFYNHLLSCEPEYQCVFDPAVYASPRPRYLKGFCAHARYLQALPASFWGQFRFAQEVEARNVASARRLQGTPSVALHVRRGDYIGSLHEVVTASYYRRAMAWMREALSPQRPTFHVFSNGMDWAREHLSGPEVEFMEGNGNDAVMDDFFLMTQCRHHIMANSTLSWLAAWFCDNPEKQVVMPDRWFNAQTSERKRFCSETAFRVEGWTALEAL